MADLLEVHNRILFHLNKVSGAYVSHDELDDILDQAQMQEFSYLLGNEREYPNIKMASDRNLKVHTELLRFKGIASMKANPFGLPSNALYIVGAINKSNNSQIKFVDEDELGGVLNSEIVAPTESYPIINIEQFTRITGKNTTNLPNDSIVLRMYPDAAPNIDIHYLARPTAPQMVYTLSGRQVLYDEENSTQLEWSDISIEKIIQRSLGMLGVHFNALNESNYYETKQANGI